MHPTYVTTFNWSPNTLDMPVSQARRAQNYAAPAFLRLKGHLWQCPLKEYENLPYNQCKFVKDRDQTLSFTATVEQVQSSFPKEEWPDLCISARPTMMASLTCMVQFGFKQTLRSCQPFIYFYSKLLRHLCS